jgi:hypothetical protein
MPLLSFIVTIFRQGWILLLAAIGYNFLALWLQLDTWYSFAQKITRYGVFDGLRQVSAASLIFLIVVYPLLLGLSMSAIQMLEKKVINRSAAHPDVVNPVE